MDLAGVVTAMDEVESCPLVCAERAKNEVSGEPLAAEEKTVLFEQSIHFAQGSGGLDQYLVAGEWGVGG